MLPCSSLKSIEIPNSVTTIGKCAFDSCSNLKSIEIPDSVIDIGDFAFDGCVELISIQVTESNKNYMSENNCLLTKDGSTLIAGCKSSVIPNCVTYIGKSSFKDCSSLEAIEIPNSVSSIGMYAFSGCSSLNSVTIHEKESRKASELIGKAGLCESAITLHVPIGTGYAYRHHPYFAEFKEIVADVR